VDNPLLVGQDVPSGDLGTFGERNDMIRYGLFRGRFEHIWRYVSASKHTLGLVADIGCGTGYGPALLGESNSVIGIDVSRNALDYALWKYPGPEYVQGSAVSLPFRDSAFDAVTAFEIVEHLEHGEKLLEEAHRILKVGGTLFISSPNPAHWVNLLRNQVFRTPIPDKEPGNLYHVHEFPYQEMRCLLDSYGFEVIWEEGIGFPIPFPGASGLGYGLFPWFGLGDRLGYVLSRLGEKFPRVSKGVIYAAKREVRKGEGKGLVAVPKPPN
jgi:SAM-dependent methyltransferase